MDYQKAYEDKYSEILEERLQALTKILDNDNGIAKSIKFTDFRESTSKALDQMSVVSTSPGVNKVDQYIKDLLERFGARESRYDRDHIELFFMYDYASLQQEYKDEEKRKNIVKPEVYAFNEVATLNYIAAFNCLLEFIQKTSGTYPEKGEDIQDYIERLRSVMRPPVTESLARNKVVTNPIIRVKLKRSSNDKLTSLTLRQTAVLFTFLRKTKVIFGKSYINNKDLAALLECLTGYSSEETRKSLGQPDEKSENLKEVQKILFDINTLIEKKLGG